jgi:hypothetical protein
MRYQGKVMTGVLELTVGRTKVKCKYAVRIGSGSKLLSPKGATVVTKR